MYTKINEFKKEVYNKRYKLTEELRGGEKRAFTMGNLIVSTEQFAVCYLVAKEALNGQEPNFQYKIANQLFEEIGMNPETFRRCVSKFSLLLTGKAEDQEEIDKEHIYPKLKNAFIQFEEMSNDDVYALAETAFTPENLEIGLATSAGKDINNALYKTEKAQKIKLLKANVVRAYMDYMKIFKDAKKATSAAITSMMKDKETKYSGITEDEMKRQLSLGLEHK